jgi:hypothetical protein
VDSLDKIDGVVIRNKLQGVGDALNKIGFFNHGSHSKISGVWIFAGNFTPISKVTLSRATYDTH